MNKEDQERFVQMIDNHRGIIRKVCSLYARDSEDFRDLQQEILLQAWKGFGSFRGDSKVSTWLYRIALNCAIMDYRRSLRRPATITSGGKPVPDNAVEDPDVGDEDFRMLHTAIRQLPEIDRAIILLHLEEYSYREISVVTGLTINTIGVRISRIKEKLKTILEKWGYIIG